MEQPLVAFEYQGASLGYSYSRSGKTTTHSVPFEIQQATPETLPLHVRYLLMPLFDGELASGTQFHLSQSIQSLPELRSTFEKCIEAIKNTNALCDQFENAAAELSKGSGILFLRADTSPVFDKMYGDVKAKCPNKTFHISFTTGFNSFTRTWEAPSYKKPKELLQFAIDNGIAKIVSLNLYYLELSFFRENIFFEVACKRLGIEYSILDIDIYDLNGYIFRSAFHLNTARRFSIWPHVQKEWDDAYALTNVSYRPAESYVDENPQIKPVRDDYGIVIASHARAGELLQHIEPVLNALEFTRPETVIADFQLFYYALRHVALYDLDFPRSLKDRVNRMLYAVYLHGTSFLKFLTIHELKTKRQVRLFGDEAWKSLFPHYFQDRYLHENDYKEIAEAGSDCFLLMNTNYSYFESNPVFQRCVNLGSPFFCFPPVVRHAKLNGLKALEYSSPQELNEKLDVANLQSRDLSLRESLGYYASVIRAGYQQTIEDIVNHQKEIQPTLYEKTSEALQETASQIYAQYISENSAGLKKFLGEYLNNKFSKKPEDLRYAQLPFAQVLLQIRRDSR